MADVVNEAEVAPEEAAGPQSADLPAPPAPKSFEPPKYIASLIAAINDSAKAAQTGALAFPAVGLYLVATAFATTDEDLLLQHTTTISQLGVQIPVVFSFAIAPLVFVALHVFTLIRYDMLATNLRQFRTDLDSMVPLPLDQERCRQLLANVEFVVTRVAPRGSPLQDWLFRWVAFSVIALFPVAVLIVVQVSSLRYQSDRVNWAQRVALGLDLAMLFWFYYRQWFPKGSYSRVRATWPKLAFSLLGVFSSGMVAAESYWLNIPGPEATTVREQNWPEDKLHGFAALGYALSQPLDLVLCPTLNWGCRFLTVDHRTLVDHVWKGEAVADLRAGSGNPRAAIAAIEGAFLRDRVLRFAKLDESRLYDADLIRADLRHATLRGTNLQNARFVEAQLQGANLGIARLQGADLSGAQLQGANLGVVNLESAFLSQVLAWRADIKGAFTQGVYIAGVVTDAKVACEKGICDWGDAFDKLKQLLNHDIPEGKAKTQALERIQILDPAKSLPEAPEIAQRWAVLQNAPPAPAVYEKGLAEQWRKIGCAADGAPYVLTNLAFMLDILDIVNMPFAKGRSMPFAKDSSQVPQLAADFLKEDCAGAHGISEMARTQLMALRDRALRQPATPNAP